MQRLHPLYKELAQAIAIGDQVFYTDEEIAAGLEEELETKPFEFARMKLVDHLLDSFEIDFIRAENTKKQRGYKIATPVESVKISAPRLQKRISNAARRQRKVLSTIDRPALPESIQKEYDAYVIRGGLLASFLAQTPLKRCLEGIQVRFDRPKIIP